jgi:hypothetical protein
MAQSESTTHICLGSRHINDWSGLGHMPSVWQHLSRSLKSGEVEMERVGRGRE